MVREVGDPVVGVLTLPVMGDLSVRETEYISKALAKRSSFVEIAKVSNRIARAEKITPLAAHRFVSQCIAASLGMGEELKGKEAEAHESRRLRYAEEVEALASFLLAQQWRRQVAMATAIIRYRVPGQEEYSETEAEALPGALVLALAQFATEEQAARTPTPSQEEEDKATAEGLGK
jgi:hypothetical protein